MDVEDSTLTEQQYAQMKLGLSALWALAVKNRACLERLLSFNREINAYLSLKTWDRMDRFSGFDRQIRARFGRSNFVFARA